MYFEAIKLDKEIPRTTIWNERHVCLFNPKTKDMQSIKPGLSTDYEYYKVRGFTHWLKPIHNNK